jgi:N6-L-threonylcarbamoyladenine synthase
MLVLGIESSCDETACAVVADGRRVLSNVVASQNDLHAEYGGVVPEIASRAHVERLTPVLRAALRDAGIRPGDIDAVAIGHRPGLIGSLLVGVAAGKALAWSLGIPLIGVDHVHAHLYAGLLDRPADPGLLRAVSGQPGDSTSDDPLPALGLVVSGGHTSIYAVGARPHRGHPEALPSILDVQRLGATIDDAIGEAFDKAASILGLGFPGGPAVDRLACEPGANDRAADLPISRLSPSSLDFSYSGLKTSLLYAARGGPAMLPKDRPVLSHERKRDLAASFQRAAVAAVTLKLGRALQHLQDRSIRPRALLAGGGVTANTAVRRELAAFASAHSLRLVLPPMHLCVDNAAMIAGLGHAMLAAGRRDTLDLAPVPTTAC